MTQTQKGSQQVHLTLPMWLIDKIDKKARRSMVTKTHVIRTILSDYFTEKK